MLKALLTVTCAGALLAGCTTLPAPDLDTTAAKATGPRPTSCLKTGTRIALKEDECVASPGRVYTKEDLDRTGEIDIDRALRQLDPTFF